MRFHQSFGHLRRCHDMVDAAPFAHEFICTLRSVAAFGLSRDVVKAVLIERTWCRVVVIVVEIARHENWCIGRNAEKAELDSLDATQFIVNSIRELLPLYEACHRKPA